MTRLAILGALTVLAVVLQTSLLSGWGPPALKPDVPMLLVLTWGLAFGGGQGLFAAALAGPMLDSTSAVPFGTHLLALMPVVLLGAARGTDLFASRASLPLILAPLATVGYYVALTLVLELVGWHADWATTLLALTGGLILNAAVSPLLFWMTWTLSLRYSEQFRTVSRP